MRHVIPLLSQSIESMRVDAVAKEDHDLPLKNILEKCLKNDCDVLASLPKSPDPA